MRTRQTFRRQMGGRCYVYVGDNSDPGKVTAQGEDSMVDSIAKVRSRESMEAQFDELDRRLAALDDAAEGEKANKPRRSRRKKNADGNDQAPAK